MRIRCHPFGGESKRSNSRKCAAALVRKAERDASSGNCQIDDAPAYRRRGIARALMEMAEERARQEGRRLLVLDTREGAPSNQLYVSLGYTRAGRIPSYAQSATGTLDATLLYYKWIG